MYVDVPGPAAIGLEAVFLPVVALMITFLVEEEASLERIVFAILSLTVTSVLPLTVTIDFSIVTVTLPSLSDDTESDLTGAGAVSLSILPSPAFHASMSVISFVPAASEKYLLHSVQCQCSLYPASEYVGAFAGMFTRL